MSVELFTHNSSLLIHHSPMSKYIRPTLETKFHIDFLWWQKNKQNLHSYLLDQSCADIPVMPDGASQFDWINPESGEVFQVDILWELIREHCVKKPHFIDEYTPLITAIFRAFIANNNTPLTTVELYRMIQKQSPELILRTIGGLIIHQGIRPVGN